MTRRSRSQRGFTLIELMTVIAIIAVVTVALASMSSSPSSGTPSTVSEQVSGLLQFARLRAEARRTTHRVQITATELTVFENDVTGFKAFTTTPNFVQQLTIPSGVILWAADDVSQPSAGQNPSQGDELPLNIDFKLDGQSTGGTIYLTDHNSASKFRVFVYKTTGTAIAREKW